MLRQITRVSRIASSSQCARAVNTNNAPTNNNDAVPLFMNNRNPRNLERLRIAYKPRGYYMDKPGRSYWHKLIVETSSKHVLAYIYHFQRGNVIEASTNEWAIKKQLYKTTDTAAYINLGRVLAERCLMMGITDVFCNLKGENSNKLTAFMKELEKGGVSLNEMPMFKTPEPMDHDRPEKPWEVLEP